MERLNFNFRGPTTLRHERLEDVDYVVAPMAMLAEGVHAGNNGPLYYSEEEVAKQPAVWNHKPVVVYHPKINGAGVSACDPIILESRKVGLMLNTTFDNKLRSEAWINPAKADKVDDRIMAALESGTPMEISTGVFTENTKDDGVWNDEPYVGTAHHLRPDHLALLPDQIGAYSVADGGGLLVVNEAGVSQVGHGSQFRRAYDFARKLVSNQLSHSNLRDALHSALRSDTTGDLWIEDVYDTFFVVNQDETLYRVNFTADNAGAVSLMDDRTEVVRVTEYRKASDGAFVGNSAGETPEGDTTMKKEQIVQSIIDNEALPHFTDDNKDALTTMSEETLAEMAKVPEKSPIQEVPAEGNKTAPPVEELVANAEPKKPQSMEEFLATAPPEFGEVLQDGLTQHNDAKQTLVIEIVANSEFTTDELAGKRIPELTKLAAAVRPAEAVAPTPTTNWAGAGGGQVAPTVNATEETAYVSPIMEFANRNN